MQENPLDSLLNEYILTTGNECMCNYNFSIFILIFVRILISFVLNSFKFKFIFFLLSVKLIIKQEMRTKIFFIERTGQYVMKPFTAIYLILVIWLDITL